MSPGRMSRHASNSSSVVALESPLLKSGWTAQLRVSRPTVHPTNAAAASTPPKTSTVRNIAPAIPPSNEPNPLSRYRRRDRTCSNQGWSGAKRFSSGSSAVPDSSWPSVSACAILDTRQPPAAYPPPETACSHWARWKMPRSLSPQKAPIITLADRIPPPLAQMPSPEPGDAFRPAVSSRSIWPNRRSITLVPDRNAGRNIGAAMGPRTRPNHPASATMYAVHFHHAIDVTRRVMTTGGCSESTQINCADVSIRSRTPAATATNGSAHHHPKVRRRSGAQCRQPVPSSTKLMMAKDAAKARSSANAVRMLSRSALSPATTAPRQTSTSSCRAAWIHRHELPEKYSRV